MPSRADLEKARADRDELRDRLAAKIVELKATEEDRAEVEDKVGAKREARERHVDNPRRLEELDRDLEQLRKEAEILRGKYRETRARAAKLERLSTRAAKRAKRIARRLRNRVSPKVIDLGFDRTANGTPTRQGTIYGSVGHYTAGPLDDDGDDESIALWTSFDRAHKAQGWIALGYNIGITRDGTIVRLRGVEYVGAHTLNFNAGRVGISVHGTTGHTWADPQLRALAVALKKYGLDDKPVIGHWQAPGQSTACPGAFLGGYTSKGAHR